MLNLERLFFFKYSIMSRKNCGWSRKIPQYIMMYTFIQLIRDYCRRVVVADVELKLSCPRAPVTREKSRNVISRGGQIARSEPTRVAGIVWDAKRVCLASSRCDDEPHKQPLTASHVLDNECSNIRRCARFADCCNHHNNSRQSCVGRKVLSIRFVIFDLNVHTMYNRIMMVKSLGRHRWCSLIMLINIQLLYLHCIQFMSVWCFSR